MAFSKKTWKDRVTQYLNRRLLTDSDGNTQQVTVTRDEGSVTEAGDAFSASNMNDLEDRIENAFDGLTAADIPYSAGVSVADKLDSLSTVESVNISFPVGVSYHHGFIAKMGKLVVCNLFVKVETTVANNGVLINGLPISAYEFRAPKFVGGSQYVNDSISGAVFMDTSNGRLSIMTAINGTTSNPLYASFNFSYLTA